MSMTDYLEAALADATLGGSTWTKPANVHVALHDSVPGDTAANEWAGNGYARVQVTNNATQWPNLSSGQKKNANDISFPALSGASKNAVGWSIWDASSAGNAMFWGMFWSNVVPFTGLSATDVITAPGHTFVDGDAVRILAMPGMSIPTGLTSGNKYFVRDTSGDTFKLAATAGGAAIDLTANGGGRIGKDQSKTVADGTTPIIQANQLIIEPD